MSRVRVASLVLLVTGGFSAGMLGTTALAQAPVRGAAPAAPARSAAPARPSRRDANLLQLMRGTLYPASNVVFAAQGDLNEFKQPADPSVSPNPLTSTYGGWEAVQNAALALVEAADLVVVPGRLCSNGKPAPVQNADWVKFTQGLREAGRAAYKAAQTKDMDKMTDASGTLSDACAACHDKYREKKNGPQDRCLP